MNTASGRHHPRRGIATLIATLLAVGGILGAPVARVTTPQGALAAGSFSDPFFREFPVFTGLTKPTTVRFASDGRAFVAEKAGVIKAFDSIADTTATTVLDLSTEVNSYWDRGLLGIALDPALLSGRPYLYLYYVYDAPPGQTAPVWNDVCPNPPSGTADGCTVTSRLERVTIDLATNVAVPGTRELLIADWCQQFPSHAGGGMAFGSDGQLYLSGGDGASFTTTDYGQRGGTLPNPQSPVTPVNPCGDPTTLLAPDPVTGAPITDVATAEGGMLRSQDVRTTGDPTGLDGTIIRIDPDTGLASTGNPLAASSDLNARRIVAHGFRNPFRWTFRPGTGELYVGDVGNSTWEEVERVVVPTSPKTATTMPNFGWPCYEGVAKSSLQSFGFNMCTNLYNQGASAVTSPLYQYSHVNTLTPTGPCFAPDANGKQSSSITGVAFYEGPQTGTAAYPSKYNGALFFADYSRNCLAALLPGAGGVPDPSTMETIATAVAHPVDLLTGPGGDLYYVDLDGGRVVRIRHLVQPIAMGTVTPAVSRAPVTVTFDASASSDPDPAFSLVAWRWDLDHDGVFTGPNDLSGKTVQWDISTPGIYPITLQVESSNGLTDTVELSVNASNDPPVPSIDSPDSTLTWAVGDQISFSGSAIDPDDGPLPPSELSWDLVMMHCPADCHEHLVQSWAGVASGTFDAPDHDYPSHLELRLTATDSSGSSATRTVILEPKTSTIAANSSPAGVPLFIAGENRPSPSTTTVIRNGQVTISAPLTTTIAGKRYRFSTWDDSLARTHEITASGTQLSRTATFVPDAPDTCADATTTSPLTSWISDRLSGNGDVDWFRFVLTRKQRVILTLGDVPVDGRLELYGSCSTRIATSDNPGAQFEEYTRTLAAGTYRVKISSPGNTWSGQAYVLRFRPMSTGLPVKSYRMIATGSQRRIVGEVLNDTGSTRGRITVTATFKNASGKVVATLRGLGFASRIADGIATSFEVSGAVPAYTSLSLSATSASAPTVPTLALATFTATSNPDGTVTEKGTVKNTGTRTARNVTVVRVWYGPRGDVLDRGFAVTAPFTLVPGSSGSFALLRPVLPTAQAARTQLRGLI